LEDGSSIRYPAPYDQGKQKRNTGLSPLRSAPVEMTYVWVEPYRLIAAWSEPLRFGRDDVRLGGAEFGNARFSRGYIKHMVTPMSKAMRPGILCPGIGAIAI
jgi:hypothetical protein